MLVLKGVLLLMILNWISFGKKLGIGINLYTQEKYEEAKVCFLKAAQINNNDFVVNFWLLRVTILLHEYNVAEEYATKCSKISHNLVEPLISPWCSAMQEIQHNADSVNIEILNHDTDQLLIKYQQNRNFKFWDIGLQQGIIVFLSFFFAFFPLSPMFSDVLSVYASYLVYILYYYYKPKLIPNLWNQYNLAIFEVKKILSNSSFPIIFVAYFLLQAVPMSHRVYKDLISGQLLLLVNATPMDKLIVLWPALVILGPICEEFAFRGLLFKYINKHSSILAYFITSILFYLSHGSHAILAHFIDSLLFCWAYKHYGSLAAPIMLHVLANFLFTICIAVELIYSGG
jgi:membrane protease YdiL (CAAX protease family)